MNDTNAHQYTHSQAADDARFEARCDLRHIARVRALAGRSWRCEECGEEYGADWVAAWGRQCHVECNGWLEEVTR
ncbi:hypothetical protein [Meiothermus granaticius]|uniref:Uncharacterized protein n=1 Tax=Meiothermus granaticius NBRC 107808 TaxID=1227551 RepID=A0A399FCJ1_9DEIN|nr:hypothetical protein [Meiothermus granaticius]RIH93968.1 hypothetical protein Mgrana_00054 [Meiothermus granaticius NBRC 107808]GEM88204.1 hypothetical protein MGR01S_28290 [Meiothermus granaticius NBRC 107808]